MSYSSHRRNDRLGMTEKRIIKEASTGILDEIKEQV